MSQIQITDNHDWRHYSYFVSDGGSESDLQNLKKIADVRIKEMTLDNNPNLLVFPRDLGCYGDDIGDGCIVSLKDENLSSGNIMGFVGVNDTQLDIRSRFAKHDEADYFLHYMLQKVFAVSLFDIKHTLSREPVFDFLLYLFPHFLKRALSQGLFKKYRKFVHNDANVKGVIDVNRHIRENVPFRGSVSYTTRAHSFDNEVTQLVRHTVEYIREKEQGTAILSCDQETRECVTQIVMATPSYSRRSREYVVNCNLKPLRHPFYSAYTALQRLCLQILRHESIKFGREKDKVYGVLFDGAWLWEEYLGVVLRGSGFAHPKNRERSGGFRMFKKAGDDAFVDNNYRRLYPDFYNDEQNFVVDAKYKRFGEKNAGREDLYQLVTYMYCKKSENGAFVFPCEDRQRVRRHQLEGYGGFVSMVPFAVPQQAESYTDFIDEIETEEDELRFVLCKSDEEL